jgi:hypothetical protein
MQALVYNELNIEILNIDITSPNEILQSNMERSSPRFLERKERGAEPNLIRTGADINPPPVSNTPPTQSESEKPCQKFLPLS